MVFRGAAGADPCAGLRPRREFIVAHDSCRRRFRVPELPSPATAPAASLSASFMHINNRLVMFPPAKLKLTEEGSRLMALLYTDDPPEAIKDDYTGNSYYLQMALDVSDVKDLAKATWSHKSRTSEREDSPFGIYFSGHKVQLQPHDQVRADVQRRRAGRRRRSR